MKSKLSSIILAAALALSSMTYVGNAAADEGKMVGPITKITLAADGKSAVALVKDAKSGETVTLTITDDLTLDKFKDKRIVVGDEIRARWEKDGKNTSKSFKKTAGCYSGWQVPRRQQFCRGRCVRLTGSRAAPPARIFAHRPAGFLSNSHSPNGSIGRLSHCPMLTT